MTLDGTHQGPLVARRHTMHFPQCDSVFESRTPDGKIMQRVCLGTGAPTYEMVVPPSACRRCQSVKGPKLSVARTNRKTPGIFRKAMSYAEAVIEWTAAGRPNRSEEEVQRIFHELCQPCKRFDPTKKICLECGCRVADGGFVLLNKIKMATQHCPKGNW